MDSNPDQLHRGRHDENIKRSGRNVIFIRENFVGSSSPIDSCDAATRTRAPGRGRRRPL